MKYEFEVKMKELDLALDNPVLDPAFVTKATDFKEKVKKHELSDDEAEAIDKELCAMLDQLDVSEEDSEEVKKANLRKEQSDAKAEVLEAENEEQLHQLAGKFLHLPEIQKLIEKRLKTIQEKQTAEDQKKIKDEAKEAIRTATYEMLPSLLESYKDYPDLVKVINARIKDEDPSKNESALHDKLLTKKEWSYAELQELGIKPTGNDMKVAGLKLEKEWFFNIYSVRK
jgi:glucan-binding YG repeat protein